MELSKEVADREHLGKDNLLSQRDLLSFIAMMTMMIGSWKWKISSCKFRLAPTLLIRYLFQIWLLSGKSRRLPGLKK
jgi:hypothetical protein